MGVVRPRCDVPDWFAPVRAAVIDDLDKVNEAIHAIDTRHTTEAQTLADAKAALHDAKTALRPFDLPFRDALKGVADAKTGVCCRTSWLRMVASC